MPFVIVDETDVGILANTSLPGGYGANFTATEFTTSFFGGVSGTAISFTALEYNFNGSSISVFGSILSVRDYSPGSDTTLGFVVDSASQVPIKIPATNETDQHINVFDSSTLSDGHHQLNISFSFPGNDSVFYLDYLIYNASDNSSITNTETSAIFIDDTSLYLQYSPSGWSPDHAPLFADVTSQDAATFNASIAKANASGANVSLTFFGNALNIYGVVLNNGPAAAAYTIDGDDPQNFTMPPDSVTFPVYNWNFLQEGRNLEEGNHNLTITSLSQSENPFYLDYILITASKAYVPPPPLITPGSGSTSSSPVPGYSSSPTLSNGRHSSHTGAIAGGVAGGAVLLGALVAAALFLRRCKNSGHRNRFGTRGREQQTEIDVDDAPPSMTQDMTPFSLTNRASQTIQRRPITKGLHLINTEEGHELEILETTTRSSNRISSGIGAGGSEGVVVDGHRRRETDSGIRALSESGITESTLPPVYTND